MRELLIALDCITIELWSLGVASVVTTSADHLVEHIGP